MQLDRVPSSSPARPRPGLLWQIGAGFFILAIPLFLIATSVRLIAQNIGFYEYGFAKYNVSARTQLPPAELTKAAEAFVEYFDSSEEWLLVTVTDRFGRTFALYNERELLHMKDVKSLFQLVFWVQIAAGLWIVLYGTARYVRFDGPALGPLRRLAIWGSVATLFVVANLGLLALLDWEAVFVQFHLISFTNDLWLLDPDRDYLLMMFPGGFFFEATLAIAALSITGALTTLLLAAWVAPRLAPDTVS